MKSTTSKIVDDDLDFLRAQNQLFQDRLVMADEKVDEFNFFKKIKCRIHQMNGTGRKIGGESRQAEQHNTRYIQQGNKLLK